MTGVSPSRQKFRIARELVQRLAKDKEYGFVDGVFVCGSVAANLALPHSDIDLIVAISGIDTEQVVTEKEFLTFLFANEFKKKRKLGFDISVRACPTDMVKAFIDGKFGNMSSSQYLHLPISIRLRLDMLEKGIIPLFLRRNYFPESKYNLRELTRRLAPRRNQIKQAYFSRFGFKRGEKQEERLRVNRKKTTKRFVG
jgi:predicted nucleotidyltransferase